MQHLVITENMSKRVLSSKVTLIADQLYLHESYSKVQNLSCEKSVL